MDVLVAVLVAVAVFEAVGVAVAVRVGVDVRVTVLVEVTVGVFVMVPVEVRVGVMVGVPARVAVGVDVPRGWAEKHPDECQTSGPTRLACASYASRLSQEKKQIGMRRNQRGKTIRSAITAARSMKSA